jgi:hypothetical protein
MGEETNFITQYAPTYIPFLAAVLIIIFTRQYLFRGMVSMEMHTAQVERECKAIEIQEAVSGRLEEIVMQLAALTTGVNTEISNNTERLRSLEHAMSDYLEAFHGLASTFQALQRDFEMHRRDYRDTEQFKLSKGD